jgi:hypothetical protein
MELLPSTNSDGNSELRMQMLESQDEDEGSIQIDKTISSPVVADHLQRIQRLYEKASIPELELLDMPKSTLLEKVEYFDNLRKLIIAQEPQTTQQEQAAISLMEKIARDMQLYRHFADHSRMSFDCLIMI